MSFFNLFKRKSKPIDDRLILFYPEEEYLMIQLVSKENRLFLETECVNIRNSIKALEADEDFSGNRVRHDAPYALKEKKIYKDEFERIVIGTNLRKANEVQTDSSGTWFEVRYSVIGYSKDNASIYFEVIHGIVTEVWFTNIYAFEKNVLSNLLQQIGIKWDLLLVDWYKPTIIDLSSMDDITNYVN